MLDGKTPAQKKKVIEAYWSGNVVVDDDGMVQKIGSWMVPDSVLIGANLVPDKNPEYGDRMKVAFNGVMPASQAPKGAPAAEADADEPDEPDEVDEDETTEEEDDAADARAEELDGLGLAELRKIAKGLGVTGKGKDGLIDAILDAEFGEPDDEDADEEEPEDDEEAEEEEADEDDEPEGDEFDDMNRAALKKYNTAEGLGVKVTTKMTDDELRDAIRAALPEDEEEPEDDEEDDEPEPPAKPARGRAKATQAAPARPAARRRGGKAAADDEPPF
jgi:hypothetical protein